MISFKNDGLLDLRAITTFGVSVKTTSNPIGFFGTGFKYAIAILLREGCRITVWRGMEKLEFTAADTVIRGHTFSLVKLNDQELGFTTDLGKKWELWQAFREIYCNCVDEPGALITDLDVAPTPDTTLVQIEGDEFISVYRNRDAIILQGKPTWVSAGVEIHDRPSSTIFYKGVRVGQFKKPAMLTYNIVGHHVSLSEDRTVAWYFEPLKYIANAVLESGDHTFVRQMLKYDTETMECDIDLVSGHAQAGATFMEVMAKLPFKELANPSAAKIYKAATGKTYEPDNTPMTDIEKEQLRRAKFFLVEHGFPVDRDPIIVTSDLPEQILACVYQEQIFLSRRIFMRGTKQVTAALLEEHIHLRHGLQDETRELQTFLFDLVITFGEKAWGKPL